MSTPVQLESIAFLIAAVCAAIMGYAIQRGATCMVAAVDEVVSKRRAFRLLAMIEAAVWVAGIVLIWRLQGGPTPLPIGYASTLATVAGGLLLGLGALVTRACVFGAIARLGSGEWAYFLTPLGFYLGCVTIWPLIGKLPPMHVASAAFDQGWLVAGFVLFVLWRAAGVFRVASAGQITQHIWKPHQATAVIGIAFAISLIAIGPWAYTYALLSLARGSLDGVVPKLVLLVLLFAGALAGGWTAGRLQFRVPTIAGAVRCLVGGVLMGWGSLLIPGGNDELLLVGLPLLQPYAWIAVISMATSIALGQIVERQLGAR